MAHAEHAEASMSALAGFGRYWVLALLAATVSAIAANMFIGVPLSAVVDVLLAVMLVGLVLAEAYFALRAISFLIAGRFNEALLWLGAMVIYLLLLFPPILAFDAYAWWTGQQLAGSSHLYDAVTGAIAGFFKFPAQLISAAMVLVLHAGSSYVNYVAQSRTWLEIAANGLSILVALRTLWLSRQRRREAHAH
jgi:hypothetical protein